MPSAAEAFGDDTLSHDPLPSSEIGSSVPSDPPLDKNGLPWDERIHASTRTRNADGSWRYKRGVADTWVVEVEKELRALMAIPVPAAIPLDQPVGASAVAPAATTTVPVIVDVPPPPPREGMANYTPGERQANLIPPPPSVPAVPLVPAVPAVSSPASTASPVSSSITAPPPPPPAASSTGEGPFVVLVKKVSALAAAGKINQDEVREICASVGMPKPELYLLSNRHDLIPTVDGLIDAMVAGR